MIGSPVQFSHSISAKQIELPARPGGGIDRVFDEDGLAPAAVGGHPWLVPTIAEERCATVFRSNFEWKHVAQWDYADPHPSRYEETA
jgi:hypothetical protein